LNQPSRTSHDCASPLLFAEATEPFQRMNSNPGVGFHKGSITNHNNNDFMISDEDLLSNVDRVSKCIHLSEINEHEDTLTDDISVLKKKILDKTDKIQMLKSKLMSKEALLNLKDNQINFL
jgi:hypothetical protein